jgi:dethiobiotin synthetase
LAPMAASTHEVREIDLHKIRASFLELSRKHTMMIVEGAGGLMTPLARGRVMADLALELGLPMLLVVPDRLGCVNHTLLTIEMARKMNIELVAVILNRMDALGDVSQRYNAQLISDFSSYEPTIVSYLPRTFSFENHPDMEKLVTKVLAALPA